LSPGKRRAQTRGEGTSVSAGTLKENREGEGFLIGRKA